MEERGGVQNRFGSRNTSSSSGMTSVSGGGGGSGGFDGSFMGEDFGLSRGGHDSPVAPGSPSTIIDLGQMSGTIDGSSAPEVLVGSNAPVGGAASLRARSTVSASGAQYSNNSPVGTPSSNFSSSTTQPTSGGSKYIGMGNTAYTPSQPPRRDPFDGLRVVNDNDDRKPRAGGRSTRGNTRETEEEPIIDEILSIMPAELRDLCVSIGSAIYPSLQIINVRTDLQETGEEIIFNAKPSKLRGYTAGLAFHIMSIAVSFVVCMLAEFIAPDFFDYPFFFFDASGIFSNWVFFLWAGLLGSAVWYLKGARVPIEPKTFLQKSINAILLAVLEEVGYRWLYIGVAMIALHTFNLFLHHAGVWLGAVVLVLAVVFFVLAAVFSAGALHNVNVVQRFFAKFNPTYTMIGGAVMMIAGLGLITGGMLWGSLFDGVWDYLVVPVTNALSLWRFDDMLNGWFAGFSGPTGLRKTRGKPRREAWKAAAPNRFFVYGMILSNITYRDGHKYQGLVGWINSWYVGLVLLSSVVHYGFFTAITIHILYELQFIAIGLLFRKLGWSRGARGSSVSHMPTSLPN